MAVERDPSGDTPASASVSALAATSLSWALFALVPELCLNAAMPFDRGATGAAVYALSAVGSWSTWWVLVAGLAALRAYKGALGWAAVAVVGPLLVSLTVASIHYRWFFGTDVRPIAIAYFLQNPGYALSLVTQSMNVAISCALFGGAAGGVLALAWLTRCPLSGASRPRAWTVGLAVVATSALVVPALGCAKYPCIAEVRGVRALVLGLAARASASRLRALPVPKRVALASVTPLRAPDVVLIINESLGASQLGPWNGRDAGAPGLMHTLQGRAGQTVWFPDAVAIAPVTAVSVPSTLTGLAPDAPIADFERAPLLWHEARARGYLTGLFTAQDLQVDFFRGYYLADGGPHESKGAGDHPALSRVNDRGVADEQPIDDALDFARRAPRDRPLLLVVQTNATHWPCWSPETAREGGTIPVRCTSAVRYVDVQLGRLVDGLAGMRDPENTLIIGTSDHGESFDPKRPARALNYYQDVLRVPLFVYAPERLVRASPELFATLKGNRTQRVCNLDVFPTVLDVWGGLPLAEGRPVLGGQSLLRPLAQRVLVAIADTEIWSPLADGFAVFDGRWKWTIDEFRGACLYDLEVDPHETRDLAGSPPPHAVERLRATLGLHTGAREVCRRVAPALLDGR